MKQFHKQFEKDKQKKEQMHKHYSIVAVYSLDGGRPKTVQIIKGLKWKGEKQNMLNSNSLLIKWSKKLESLSNNKAILHNQIKELWKWLIFTTVC